ETMRQLEPYWKEAIRAGEPIARDNPAGVDFLLDRVSDAELLKLPPTLAVYQARLLRTGVPMEARQEALAAIAKANNSEPTVELIKAIEHADRTGAAATVVQLASMLTQASSPAALKP